MTRRERAMKFIRECRQSHVDWIEYIESGGYQPGDQADVIEVAGDVELHREWVEKYDYVLSVLRDTGG